MKIVVIGPSHAGLICQALINVLESCDLEIIPVADLEKVLFDELKVLDYPVTPMDLSELNIDINPYSGYKEREPEKWQRQSGSKKRRMKRLK